MFERLSLILVLSACSTPAGSTQSALSAVPIEAHDALVASALPVLTLPSPYAEQTVAVAGEHFWSQQSTGAEFSVLLQGTHVVHHTLEGQALPANASVRGFDARTTVNESIRIVSWAEPGAYFTLEVECHQQPLEDTRCSEPEFALAIAQDLHEGVGQ